MESWMLDMSLLVIAVLCMAYALFKLLFSSTEANRRELAAKPRPTFERRDAERVDRRRRKGTPPMGTERRIGPRR